MRSQYAYDLLMRNWEMADRIEADFLRNFRHYLKGLPIPALNVGPGFDGVVPNVTGTKVDRFYGGMSTGSITTSSWMSWRKPKNATMHMFIAIGSGSGAGGGLTGASLSARGGGGGGASGAFARLLIPSFFLPKQIYFLPGPGGLGGAASAIGKVGNRSLVGSRPGTFTSSDLILASGAVAATNGAVGTAAGGVVGGAAETIVTSTSSIFTAFGSFNAIAGQGGGLGGAITPAAGAAVAAFTTGIPVSGGAGGGSASTADTTSAGGAITGLGQYPTLPGGAAGGGAGNAGLDLVWPWVGTGGSGGGGTGASGVAGRGGDGGYSCGGGGGGGGFTAGAGGNGGPGLCFAISW